MDGLHFAVVVFITRYYCIDLDAPPHVMHNASPLRMYVLKTRESSLMKVEGAANKVSILPAKSQDQRLEVGQVELRSPAANTSTDA